MAKPNDFDIPRPHYFDCGNIFTGSQKDLNYRIAPEDGKLNVSIWHGFINSELAQMEDSASFDLSDEGLAELIKWLDVHYRK